MRNWRNYLVEATIFVLGLAAVNAIFISRAFRQTTTIDPENAEHLGAFVGGYVGSFFSLTGIVLLFATLKNQRQSSEVQSFETKYFELLRLHRENVTEMQVAQHQGRRVFLCLMKEYRYVLPVIRRSLTAANETEDLTRCSKIAYLCMFYGVGPNSNPTLLNSLKEVGIEDKLGRVILVNLAELQKQEGPYHNLGYVPCDGHQSRLGHYYRHLYQMVRYVDQKSLRPLDKPKRYEYIKTIRAQLSTFEQALLLLNSLTPMGRNWWTADLIENYRLVQNIPQDFFDSAKELDLRSFFKQGYFEWEETGAQADGRG